MKPSNTPDMNDLFNELSPEQIRLISEICKNHKIKAKDVAQKMGYSEVTIRAWLTDIYKKAHIEGDDNEKKQMLIKLFCGGEAESVDQPKKPKLRFMVAIYFIARWVVNVILKIGNFILNMLPSNNRR